MLFFVLIMLASLTRLCDSSANERARRLQPISTRGLHHEKERGGANAVLTADVEELSAAIMGGISSRLEPIPTNVVYSPASIIIALAALSDGANGRTQYELFSKLWPRCSTAYDDTWSQVLLKLRRDIEDNEHMTLNMSNGIFVDKTLELKPRYAYLIRNIHMSTLESVDFKNRLSQSVQHINKWAENRTGIKYLWSRGIYESTILVLANAIHFKGGWASKFDKKKTKPMPFHASDGSRLNVEMMEHHYDSGVVKPLLSERYTMVGLPYYTGNDQKITMYFALPKNEEENIREIDWSVIHELTRSEPQKSKVHVQIPKFGVEYEPNLKAILKEDLGLGRIFSKTEADFSNLADPKDRVYVSDTVHKTKLEVDEEGAEAAAVVASSSHVIKLKLDRPFVFLVKHEDLDLPLFAGFIEKPEVLPFSG